MEPFKLTLEQVNFQNELLLPSTAQRETEYELDSFSNVVNFDSEFDFKTTVSSPYPTHPSAVLLSSGIPDTVRKKPGEVVPCTTESKPCDTRVYCVWTEKKLNPFDNEHLVNPYINFNEHRSTGPSYPSTSLTSPTTSASDISTLIQVSANTKSVTSKLEERNKRWKSKVAPKKMASTEVTAAPSQDRNPLDNSNCDVSNAFETVAEALHLQWSVIGNKNLTPAPPEVVAQIVAEAEKRLKAGNLNLPNNETLLSPISSANLPDISQESASFQTEKYDSPTKFTCLGAEPFHHTPNPVDNAPTVSNKEKFELLGGISDSTSLNKIKVPAESISVELTKEQLWLESRPTEKKQLKKTADTTEYAKQKSLSKRDEWKELERNPTDAATAAISVTAPNVMSSSVSLSPNTSAFPDSTSTTLSLPEQVPKETGGDRKTSENGRSEETDSIKSTSFQLSDCDEDYNYEEDSNAEAFLRSLPPVKAVELDAFLKRLRNGRHSPPVRERSFNPVELSLESENFSRVRQPPLASGKYSPPTKDVPDNMSVGSSVEMPEKDLSLPPSNFAQHIPSVSKPKISLPDPGPLFKNAMKPLTERKSQIVTENQSAGVMKVDGINVNELLREKAKLEGQLEILTSEAQTALQERAELQAQLASLQLRFMSAQKSDTDVKQNALRADIESLKDSRVYLEHCLADTQKLLEEKMEDAKRLDEELKATQETTDKQQIKVRELKDDLRARDITIQALKNKVAELYVEVQTTLQSKMLSDTEARAAKSDLASIVSTKQWYHDQLQNANKIRVELQKEMTTLQAQVSSQGTIVERLKADNARLHQQLSETRQKAVSEKEMLARQLENIQVDMLERETAFQEIQRERRIIEETFDSKIQTVEEEKMRLSVLMQTTTELESQLERAQNDLKKKQVQIFSLETEQTTMMKNLMISEGKLTEKDKVIEELEQKLIEVETTLKTFYSELSSKNQEILKLKEDKASVEISLASALEEKKIFDAALETLRGDLHKVENSFWQMKQELGAKMTELDQVRKEKSQVEIELKEAIESAKIQQDVATERGSSAAIEAATENLNKLETKNKQLTQEVAELRSQMTELNDRCVHEVHEKEALEKHLGSVQEELNQVKCEFEKEKQTIEELSAASSSMAEDGKKTELLAENSSLKSKLKTLEKKAQTSLTKQKARSAKLTADIVAVKNELMERQKAYDTNMEMLSSKLREVVNDKEALQNEVDMLKRKFDLSMIEQQDQMKVELQTLAAELETVRSQKLQLESELGELREVTNHQVEQYVSQVMAMGQQLQQLIDEKDEAAVEAKTKEHQLSLELEKEKGRLTGLQQSNTALKKHVSELEEALARRESSLVEIQTHFSDNVKEREADERDYVKRIQELEDLLMQEKSNQRELRKQIGTKITENKRLKRQHKNLSLEHENLELDVQQKMAQYDTMVEELQAKKDEVQTLQSQLQSVHHDNKALRTEVERLQRSLTDNQDRSPVIQEQLQGFQWQLHQKTAELEAVQKQLVLSEERHQTELESLKKTLQNATKEMENLRSELNTSRQEKMNHQTKVAELRSALKTSIQHHKISKKVSSKIKSPAKKTKEANDSEAVSTEEVEPSVSPSKLTCRDVGTQMDNNAFEANLPTSVPEPFDIEALEQLLQDTTVQALDSKPLDDLQSCLSSLRAQISGLQDQIDAHSATIQNSGESWRDVEAQVVELQQVVQTVTNTTSCSTLTTAVAAQSESSHSNIPDMVDI